MIHKAAAVITATAAIIATAVALFAAFAQSARADIPVRWETDAYRVKPLVYECYHGETLDMAATLTAYGDPLDLRGKTARLWWQTNGMDAAWWHTNAEVRVDAATGATNVLAATWFGACDTGADEVRGFIGVEGENYRAAFTLRLRHSPGFAPALLPLPARTIDWGAVANERAELAPFALKGSGGVTAPEATNIAAGVVARDVAPWALAGQARPTADLTAATNYTDAATNALAAETSAALSHRLPAEHMSSGFWQVDGDMYAGKFIGGFVGVNGWNAVKRVNVYGAEVGNLAADMVTAAGAATNYTDAAVGAVSNTTWTALGSKRELFDLSVYTNGFDMSAFESRIPSGGKIGYREVFAGEYAIMWHPDASDPSYHDVAAAVTVVNPSTQTVSLMVTELLGKYGEQYFYDLLGTKHPQIPIASSHRITTTTDLTAATNGLYSAAAGNALAAQVATIGAHLNAEDAQFIVTNYNSVTHMPEAYFKIKLPDQSWTVIWNEMTRFNWLTNSYLPTSYASKEELNEKADRAWGYYDSHSGNWAPEGYTWISSPKIAIAADLAYQRTITSAGNVWVLCSQGMVTETGGDTNGYFRISDNKGHTAFEIVAGEERLIGAPVTNVTTAADTIIITYPVNARPTIEVCDSLTNHLWKVETDNDCIATVTWSGQAGAWVATVTAKQTPQPQMFVQATYKTGGETIVRNTAPVSLTHVYIGGTKYAVGTATISGHTVMTLTPAN